MRVGPWVSGLGRLAWAALGPPKPRWTRGGRMRGRPARCPGRRGPPRARRSVAAEAAAERERSSMGTSGATSAHLCLEMVLERVHDIGERLQVLGCQRVSKMLLDGPQVRRTCTPERRCAAFRERDLGTATVGGAVVAPDEAALLHPSEVMGQPTSLPLDDCRQLPPAQTRALGFSKRQQHLIVCGRETNRLL